MTPYRKILVPLDDTELGQRALDVALRMAETFDADLVLLHVRDRPADLDAGAAERSLDAIEDEGNALLLRAHQRAREIGARVGTIRTEIRAGQVVEAIVAAATDTMSDLVIMGTHGRQGLGEMITGSMTERVVARCTASVLAVKPVGYPYLRDEGRSAQAK